jgi:hypothetical protein
MEVTKKQKISVRHERAVVVARGLAHQEKLLVVLQADPVDGCAADAGGIGERVAGRRDGRAEADEQVEEIPGRSRR